jgi:shikimate dehydrogenase
MPGNRARAGGRTVALIGYPVGHSVSPAMHRAAFAAVGSDLDYVVRPVMREALPTVFPELVRTHVGLNVTSPLKEAVVRFVDVLSPAAAACGSVNTVRFEDRRVVGESTDGAGFLAALHAVRQEPARRAVVLGTGGAARAVVAALMAEGTTVVVSGRNPAAGRRLVADADQYRNGTTDDRPVRGPRPPEFVPNDPRSTMSALAEADLLVNATPVGSWPHEGALPLPDASALHPGLTVVDLVYRPRQTALLLAARSMGCGVVEGIEMLIEQGALAFELWTGQPCPVAVMREAAYRAVEESPPQPGEEPALTRQGG